MGRQTVVVKDGRRVEPGNLDFLPKEYRRIPPPLHRKPDKYDAMWSAHVQSGQIQPPKAWSDKWNKNSKA